FNLFGLHYRVGTGWSMYGFLAVCFFLGLVIALRIVRSPAGAVFSAIRENPVRAAALRPDVHAHKLTALVIAAAYAGFAGGLLGVVQAFMPPEAFTFDTSGQLVIQTAIGGAGTLFGPLLGAAVWLSLRDFLQGALGLGATWKLVLGIAFVLLVCFLRRGLIGAIEDLCNAVARRGPVKDEPGHAVQPPGTFDAARQQGPRIAIVNAPVALAIPKHSSRGDASEGPILTASHLTKRYGGL